jgi:hypothetical protein
MLPGTTFAFNPSKRRSSLNKGKLFPQHLELSQRDKFTKSVFLGLVLALSGTAFHAQATEVSKYSVSCQQELTIINDKINYINSVDDVYKALFAAHDIFDAYGNRGLSILRNTALDPQMIPTAQILLENRIFQCRQKISDRLTQIRSLLK